MSLTQACVLVFAEDTIHGRLPPTLVVTHDWVILAWTVGRCAVCSWNTVAAFGVDLDRWQGVRAGPRWGAEQTVFLDPRLWASSSASLHPFLHLKTRLEIDDLVSFL